VSMAGLMCDGVVGPGVRRMPPSTLSGEPESIGPKQSARGSAGSPTAPSYDVSPTCRRNIIGCTSRHRRTDGLFPGRTVGDKVPPKRVHRHRSRKSADRHRNGAGIQDSQAEGPPGHSAPRPPSRPSRSTGPVIIDTISDPPLSPRSTTLDIWNTGAISGLWQGVCPAGCASGRGWRLVVELAGGDGWSG